MNTFQNRLNELLKEHNLNEKSLANLLKIKNLSTVYNWTGGNFTPKIDIIIDIANIFKCSTDFLLGLSDNNETIKPKICPPFYTQLELILKDKGLKIYNLRKDNIISAGLAESIFTKHSTPLTYNVIKIADYLKISIDELVGRV